MDVRGIGPDCSHALAPGRDRDCQLVGGEAVSTNSSRTARMRSKQFSVDLSEELITELRELFGPERIRLVKV